MLDSPLNKSLKPVFLQSTIIGHFQQAREINREAEDLEDKILDLADRCEIYRETVHKEQVKFDQTMTKYNLTPKAFYKTSIQFPNGSFDDEENPKILALKREIKDLKFKLHMVKKESLKYKEINDEKSLAKNQIREINFAKTLSPKIASNLQNKYYREKDYNEQIAALKEQISDLDKRKILAERILANPIDNLYEYEVLADKAEKSQMKLQQRYETASPIRIDISEMEMSVQRLELDNKTRYQNLMKRQKNIETMKNNQQNRMSKSPYTPKNKKKKTLPQFKQMKRISVENKIQEMDEIFHKIELRAGKLENQEVEIDKLTQEMIRKRDHLESIWEEKMTKVNTLSNAYREIQNIQMQIHSVAEQNTRIKLVIIDIDDEKSRLGREQSSFISNKSSILKMQSDIKLNENSIVDSQNQIESKERQLLERKRKLEISKEEVRKKKEELQLLNNRVELIESEVARMKANINIKHHEVKQELTELSISFAENSYKQNETQSLENQFSDLDSFV